MWNLGDFIEGVLFCLVWDTEGRGSAQRRGCGPGKRPRLHSQQSLWCGKRGPGLQAHPYSPLDYVVSLEYMTELNQAWSCGPRVGRAVVHESLISLCFLRHRTPLTTHGGRLCIIFKPSPLKAGITEPQRDLTRSEKPGVVSTMF